MNAPSIPLSLHRIKLTILYFRFSTTKLKNEQNNLTCQDIIGWESVHHLNNASLIKITQNGLWLLLRPF